MNDFILASTPNDLDAESAHLIGHAERALVHAYAPYSGFSVSAALLLENGVILTGTNQENAAYPSGLCAERVALFTLASQHPGVAVKKMVVVARGQGASVLTPAACCGACRQVMLEFEQRQHKPFEVVMLAQEGQWVKAPSAQSLLPFSFNPDVLGATKIS